VGLLRRVVMLPLAPVEGVVWLTSVLARIAEEELSDPTRLRATLAEAEERHRRGELTDAEMEAIEDEILDRLVQSGALPSTSLGSGPGSAGGR